MLALGSFDNSTAQNATVRQDMLKGARLNGPQNRGNPGRWCQSHKRPLPSTGNFLSTEVLTDVWFTDESGATKKLSYIKIKADERGLAIIRSLTPLPTSNELNRSPENTLIPYHFLSLVSFARSAAAAVEGCKGGGAKLHPNTHSYSTYGSPFLPDRAKRCAIIPSDLRFSREIEGGELRSDKWGPTPASKIRKKESQSQKRARKATK
jgi:hypothetical protein